MRVFRQMVSMVALLGVVGSLAATAASALAQQALWQSCVKTSEGNREKGCTTEVGETGEYEWLALAESTTIAGHGSLSLGDTKASPSELLVKCTSELTGTAAAEGQGTIKTLTLGGCSVVKGTCESVKVTAGHLPWKTVLMESEGKIRGELESDGSGAPLYTITCGVKTEDKCEYEKATVGLENPSKEALVEAKFDGKTGKAICNHAEKSEKSATGTIEGSVKLEAAQTGVEGLHVALDNPIISAVRQTGSGSRRKECTFAETGNTCVVRVSAFLNPLGTKLKITTETLNPTRGTGKFRYIVPGGNLGGLRECITGLKLVNNATERACAAEIQYIGPARPAVNEWGALYEVKAEEEGTGLVTPTTVVALTTG
jgi:hypothetical protein